MIMLEAAPKVDSLYLLSGFYRADPKVVARDWCRNTRRA